MRSSLDRQGNLGGDVQRDGPLPAPDPMLFSCPRCGKQHPVPCRVRLENRIGRRLIRWGKQLQDDANGRVRQATAEYVEARDADR